MSKLLVFSKFMREETLKNKSYLLFIGVIVFSAFRQMVGKLDFISKRVQCS